MEQGGLLDKSICFYIVHFEYPASRMFMQDFSQSSSLPRAPENLGLALSLNKTAWTACKGLTCVILNSQG